MNNKEIEERALSILTELEKDEDLKYEVFMEIAKTYDSMTLAEMLSKMCVSVKTLAREGFTSADDYAELLVDYLEIDGILECPKRVDEHIWTESHKAIGEAYRKYCRKKIQEEDKKMRRGSLY